MMLICTPLYSGQAQAPEVCRTNLALRFVPLNPSSRRWTWELHPLDEHQELMACLVSEGPRAPPLKARLRSLEVPGHEKYGSKPYGPQHPLVPIQNSLERLGPQKQHPALSSQHRQSLRLRLRSNLS